MTVYNEEERLDDFIEFHSFCEHFYISVKKSEDKTLEKALSYRNVTVIDLPFSQPSGENEHFKSLVLPKINSKWLLSLSASDRVSKNLFEQIIKYIQLENCDVLSLPFQNVILNYSSPRSPFPSLCYKPLVAKTSVANYKPEIHRELQYTSKKQKRLPYLNDAVMNYSKAITDQAFIEKIYTYARTEVDQYKVKSLYNHPYIKRPIISFLKILFNSFFRRRTILDKKNGAFFLGFAYLLNHVMIMFILFYELNCLSKEEKNSPIN